jgi:hypothetical protein
VKPRIAKYWPRLFGYALLLLVAGSVGRSVPAQRDAKRHPQMVALQQRSAVLPQTSHNLTFRSAVLHASGTLDVAGTACVHRALEAQVTADRLHSTNSWRPDAARPPPLSA